MLAVPATVTSAATIVLPPACTVDASGNRFLLADTTSLLGKRIIIFINDMFLDKLNDPQLSMIFLDGTFKISPKFFKQVWILRGFISDICFPLAYLGGS